jgi:uncharacterized membrane protein (DUF4010 family)
MTPEFSANLPGLAVSLAVGLLIGLERGWRGRSLAEGGRIAGLRTFALTGLLGGLLAAMKDELGAMPLVGALLGLSILMAVAYREARKASGDLSITTAVALLLTLTLGATAGLGHMTVSLGAAVVVALLLNLKPVLHRWLHLIEHEELAAGLQLLVLSVVILPNLPDLGMGPYQALNPYRLWLAVVLIAALSLAGHVAMRFTGVRRGIFWTGVLGGLASSTAATLTLARCAASQPALAGAALAGVFAACAMMFLRVTVLIGALAPALLMPYGAPLVITGLALLGLGAWQWRRLDSPVPGEAALRPMAPFDISTALGFGLLLALVALLVPWARDMLGANGIHVVAALSGLADVDAIVVTVTQLQGLGQLALGDCILALNLALLANSLSKVGIAWVSAGTMFGLEVLAGFAFGIAPGVLALAFTLSP